MMSMVYPFCIIIIKNKHGCTGGRRMFVVSSRRKVVVGILWAVATWKVKLIGLLNAQELCTVLREFYICPIYCICTGGVCGNLLIYKFVIVYILLSIFLYFKPNFGFPFFGVICLWLMFDTFGTFKSKDR